MLAANDGGSEQRRQQIMVAANNSGGATIVILLAKCFNAVFNGSYKYEVLWWHINVLVQY